MASTCLKVASPIDLAISKLLIHNLSPIQWEHNSRNVNVENSDVIWISVKPHLSLIIAEFDENP